MQQLVNLILWNRNVTWVVGIDEVRGVTSHQVLQGTSKGLSALCGHTGLLHAGSWALSLHPRHLKCPMGTASWTRGPPGDLHPLVCRCRSSDLTVHLELHRGGKYLPFLLSWHSVRGVPNQRRLFYQGLAGFGHRAVGCLLPGLFSAQTWAKSWSRRETATAVSEILSFRRGTRAPGVQGTGCLIVLGLRALTPATALIASTSPKSN